MKKSKVFLLVAVSVLLALAVGVTWVMATSSDGGHEGRRIVSAYCPAGGSNFCDAVCPAGFVLVGGGGWASVEGIGDPLPISMEPYCSDDSQGCAYDDADAWRISHAGGLTGVAQQSFAICFQERFGSFIPLTR